MVGWVGYEQIFESRRCPRDRYFRFSLFLCDLELCVALSELDRGLIKDCIEGDPQAWKNFCDRFSGLVMDVVEDTVAFSRGSAENSIAQFGDVQVNERLAEGFFEELRGSRFAMLRAFRGDSSLATYLAVLARRSILSRLSKSQTT